MIYVLIIVSVIYGGQQVSFQEFTNMESCEAARKWVENNRSDLANYRDGRSTCVQK